MKKVVFVVLVSILFSCNKQPVVSFTRDKSYYMSGDVVKLTNTSKDAKTYLWQLPDGKTSTGKDVEFTLSSDPIYESLKTTLTGYSKNGKQTAIATDYIEVIPAMGSIVFWKSSSCGCSDITVSVELRDVNIYSEFATAPSCGTSGAGTFSDLQVGDYTYSATDGVKTWNGNFTITKRCCLNIQLN